MLAYPDGSTGRCTSEGKELDRRIIVKSRYRNNAVANRGSSSSADGQSSGHFKDETEDHGLLVCDGA